jgi:hypothetical protein
MLTTNTIATGLSALVLAGVFPIGGRLQPGRKLIRNEGILLSLGAGVSIAYVFVHMMPEMAGAREAYARSTSLPVMFRGMLVYFVAMLGFMVYYGLENLRRGVRSRSSGQNITLDYGIHLGGFAVYVWMISYLLVNRVEKTPMSIALYTVAMIAHFLTIDHSLREDHGALYERTGRLLLAGMSLLGWGVGLVIPLPLYVLALMLAFVSGAIIMNSAIMELPHRKDERFLGFLAGGILYGLLLIPLG